MSSRLLGQPQERPDNCMWNANVTVRTADGSRRTADAADEQCLRCGCSSLTHTVVPCAADIVGPLHTALAVAIGYICAMHEERPKNVAASEMFVVGYDVAEVVEAASSEDFLICVLV